MSIGRMIRGNWESREVEGRTSMSWVVISSIAMGIAASSWLSTSSSVRIGASSSMASEDGSYAYSIGDGVESGFWTICLLWAGSIYARWSGSMWCGVRFGILIRRGRSL